MKVVLLIAGLAALVQPTPGTIYVVHPYVASTVGAVIPEHKTVLGFFEADLEGSGSKCEDTGENIKGDDVNGRRVCWVSLRGRSLDIGTTTSGGPLDVSHYIDISALDERMGKINPSCLDRSAPCKDLQSHLLVKYDASRYCDVSGVNSALGFGMLGYTFPGFDEKPRPLAAGLELEVTTASPLVIELKPLGGRLVKPLTIKLKKPASGDVHLTINNSPVTQIVPTLSLPIVDHHSMAFYDLSAVCADAATCPSAAGRPVGVALTAARGMEKPCSSTFAGSCSSVATAAGVEWLPLRFPWEFLNDDHRTPFFDACVWGPPICPKAVFKQ